MNAVLDNLVNTTEPDLTGAMSIALAELLPPGTSIETTLRNKAPLGSDCAAIIDAVLGHPRERDASLMHTARALDFSVADIIAVALARATDSDPVIPEAIRTIQGQAFGPWPSFGLLSRILAMSGHGQPNHYPHVENAFSAGIITRTGERAPAFDECFVLAESTRMAFGLGGAAPIKPLTLPPASLPRQWYETAQQIVRKTIDRPTCLVLRTGDAVDRRWFASTLASCFGQTPIQFTDQQPGLGVASMLGNWLPVEEISTVAGRRASLLALDPYTGPRVVLADREGGIEHSNLEMVDIVIPTLSRTDKQRLWKQGLPDEQLPEQITHHRFGMARIGGISARANLRTEPSLPVRLRAAMGEEFRTEFEPQATWVSADTADDEFIVDATIAEQLDVLLSRCQFRSQSVLNRVPGVRALLSGPSGTGKTLACSWIATKLCLPLFKIDLSSVVSKYIGETEENLARVLDRAEDGDVVLLMDEADSLFGSRTETRDSSDRFANNQTNYLLSRIETFDGIAILTSNSPERFDDAFTRRLDQIVEFAIPSARQRRDIWRTCLDSAHQLNSAEINRIAGQIDVAGGTIRNIVQTAAVLATREHRPVVYPDIVAGATMEYRKLGRTLPQGI